MWKDGANAGFAFDGNAAAVIGDDGLHDREAKSRAVLFGSVVGRKNSFRFFGGESRSGVGDFERNSMLDGLGAQHQHAARRHGVHGVQDKVFDGAMKESGIGLNNRQIFFEVQFRRNRRAAHGTELRFRTI